MSCPGFERIIDYLDGQLAPALAVEVAAHVAAGCGRCAADLAWYERVKSVAAADDSVEPPPWVLKRAVRLFETTRARARASRPLSAASSLRLFTTARLALCLRASG